LREYRYHQDAATGSIRADEEADMYELCDLDVKAAPFARAPPSEADGDRCRPPRAGAALASHTGRPFIRAMLVNR
jgi:hypothetical protein